MKKYLSKPVIAGVLAVLCCALWGSAFPVIKMGYSVMSIDGDDRLAQILFAGVRFTLAGVFALIIGSVIAKKPLLPTRRGLYKIPALAAFQTVLQYLFFYFGLANTTGTKSSILNSVGVFFAVIIAVTIVRTEKLTAFKGIGCIIGFAGVVLINLSKSGFDGSFSFSGEGFIILSALASAISSVLVKQFSKDDSPVMLSGWQFVFGGLVMIAVGVFSGARLQLSLKAIAIICYLAMLSAVAYTLWSLLLKYNDISTVSVFKFMIPVFGCLLSALMLGERLTQPALQVFGALALVSVGIILVNIKSKKGEAYEGKNYTC